MMINKPVLTHKYRRVSMAVSAQTSPRICRGKEILIWTAGLWLSGSIRKLKTRPRHNIQAISEHNPPGTEKMGFPMGIEPVFEIYQDVMELHEQ
jgi:hypothetical protein